MGYIWQILHRQTQSKLSFATWGKNEGAPEVKVRRLLQLHLDVVGEGKGDQEEDTKDQEDGGGDGIDYLDNVEVQPVSRVLSNLPQQDEKTVQVGADLLKIHSHK